MFILIGGVPAGALTEINDLFVVLGVGGKRPAEPWTYRVVSQRTMERAMRMHVVQVAGIFPPGQRH